MNGIHDMGGMHGMGPVEYDRNEPVFREPWEARAWALVFLRETLPTPRVSGFRRRNFRYEHEILPPVDYLRMSYYERSITVLIDYLLRGELVTRAEIESGRPDPALPTATPLVTPAVVALVAARPRPLRQVIQVRPRFKTGDLVRARNINPVGHTRLPRYTRGKRGAIVREHGAFPFPDTDAGGYPLSDESRYVYMVRFGARELWGEQAAARDAVYVSLWEDYLEPD